ncbi:hypothetical protein D3C72_2289430 [compost metagenome]
MDVLTLTPLHPEPVVNSADSHRVTVLWVQAQMIKRGREADVLAVWVTHDCGLQPVAECTDLNAHLDNTVRAK